MNRTVTETTIDCVALKRRAQSKIYEETKGMSVRQQVAYYRKRAQSGTLGSWWKRLSGSVVRKRAA